MVKITCVERKYKIQSEDVNYFVTAKRELDEDITGKLLHEDMELKTFLEYYEITGFQQIKEISEREISAKEFEISGLVTQKTQEHIDKIQEERPTLAKFPSPLKREWVILHEMPEEFAMEDIIKFYKERDERYNMKSLKSRYSNTLQNLKRRNKIESLNPEETNRRHRRYRKLVDERREFEKVIESLKMDKKVLLGTIR